jgi:hypothetical protein
MLKTSKQSKSYNAFQIRKSKKGDHFSLEERQRQAMTGKIPLMSFVSVSFPKASVLAKLRSIIDSGGENSETDRQGEQNKVKY